MPDELWNEVRDIVQETGIKNIPMEKKCKKAKWLSGEALQIAVKRREAKSKGEKERYKHVPIMTCNCNDLLFFVRLLIVKTILFLFLL